ncbi:zinc finger protein 391-like isoform X2 [Bradysia coprophila]|uniref:zinc finger protein 391-like isoform X2 n=1 Tax=Bradysia coprophila TaxID=38358 RepID=UPI00187DC46F|nr:zinc finger protein 391-like isoform X2 [Bradysia coprophila]
MDTAKYNAICRICLNESSEMNNIFGNTDSNILHILISLADIQINENDGLPAQICSSCLYEANSACFFKIKCQESDKLLRNSLQQSAYEDVKTEEILHGSHLQSIFNNCESKTTNDFFKSELNYDAVADPANFVKDIFQEQEVEEEGQTASNVPDSESQPADTMEPDAGNCEIVTSKDRIQTDKQQPSGDVKRKANLQCSECDEIFNKKIDLKRHLSVDHIQNDGEKTHKCIECSKMYSTEALLGIHMKTHSKVYLCEHCDKKFHRLDIYVEHQKRHTNLRTHLCPKCGKGFFNQLYLERHIVTHNKDNLEKPVYECTVCGKRMKHSNHLLVHMRSHKNRTGPLNIDNENKKVILCSVCGRSCSSMSNLAVHMRRHSGKMTNFCKVCGKGYPRTTDLTIHMRQHTGEKPFICNLCNRSFARSDKLVIHIRTHTGEKPYVCSVCGRAFAQSNDLASHKRRTVCSPPEPPNNSINTLYTIDTNDIIQQPIANESQANASFQHSAKFIATTNNQVTFGSGRQSYQHVSDDPKIIEHPTVTVAQPHLQRFGDFQPQYPTPNLLPTFTAASYR